MARRRLFAALLLSGRVAQEVEGLRRALGSREIDRVPPHITLAPPLHVAEDAVDDAVDWLRQVAATARPLTLGLGPPATFAPTVPVVYLAVGGAGTERLRGLRDDLVDPEGPLAPPPDRPERHFVPHVTINQNIDPGRIPAALEALAHYRAEVTLGLVTLLSYAEAERRWEPLADAALAEPAVYGRGGLEVTVTAGSRPSPVEVAWINDTWRQYSSGQYGRLGGPDEPVVLVARLGGEIVGSAECELRPSLCRLARLVVAPAWRGHGVGGRLLDEVERLALARGVGRVRLETLEGEPAQAFYAGKGYLGTAALPRWRAERDFVVMERDL